MLEDKQAQDMAHRRQEAEREQLQNKIAQLRQELEKKRGFWSRLFGHLTRSEADDKIVFG